jgi:hypothetical protein
VQPLQDSEFQKLLVVLFSIKISAAPGVVISKLLVVLFSIKVGAAAQAAVPGLGILKLLVVLFSIKYNSHLDTTPDTSSDTPGTSEDGYRKEYYWIFLVVLLSIKIMSQKNLQKLS